MMTLLLALAMSATGAQDMRDPWVSEATGTRHVPSGVVCPAKAGHLVLAEVSGTAERFTCSYDYDCPEDADCGNASAFASVTWDPALDFNAKFTQLLGETGLADVPISPDYGAPVKRFAQGGEGADRSFAGWWTSGKANVGALYNVAAEPDVQALVRAAAAANP